MVFLHGLFCISFSWWLYFWYFQISNRAIRIVSCGEKNFNPYCSSFWYLNSKSNANKFVLSKYFSFFLVAGKFYLGWKNKIDEQHFLCMKTDRFYPCLELQDISLKNKNPCFLTCCSIRLYLLFCYLKRSLWDVITSDRTKLKSSIAITTYIQSYHSGHVCFVFF